MHEFKLFFIFTILSKYNIQRESFPKSLMIYFLRTKNFIPSDSEINTESRLREYDFVGNTCPPFVTRSSATIANGIPFAARINKTTFLLTLPKKSVETKKARAHVD
jgi:hypothetical protein